MGEEGRWQPGQRVFSWPRDPKDAPSKSLIPFWVGNCSLARLLAQGGGLGLRRPRGFWGLERGRERGRERSRKKSFKESGR